jgi:putative ABC transport system ATP-binding protein
MSGIAIHCAGVVQIYESPDKDVERTVALRGIDLDVDAGEFVALLGPSGSGKSTILTLLAGIVAPSAGKVLLGEHDIGRMPQSALARLRSTLVATVLQDPGRNLLPYATVRENVWFAAPDRAARKRADELLGGLGLGGIANKVVGRLSGGEQQRAAIGAAACSGAQLILADEPTSQLDATALQDVVGLLEQVNRELGSTIVLVTHDERVASHADRTVTIRDGRVGAEGRLGRTFAVIAHDGSLQLPPDVLDDIPAGTLLDVHHAAGEITLTVRSEGAP